MLKYYVETSRYDNSYWRNGGVNTYSERYSTEAESLKHFAEQIHKMDAKFLVGYGATDKYADPRMAKVTYVDKRSGEVICTIKAKIMKVGDI